MQIKVRGLALFAVALVVSAFLLLIPPIAQDQMYHAFADSRTIWGIVNFWNVISNLPFAVVGLIGLYWLREAADRVLFAGVLLTFFGSSYYHLAPSDARLVWDRLPMTLVFMSLLACVVTEMESKRRIWLLWVLVACGAASVGWWRMTGDLRPYLLVQFGPLLVLIPALWRVREPRFLTGVLIFYGMAKFAELYDRLILTGLPISGHTIKHLLAASATYFVFLWRRRVKGGPVVMLSRRTEAVSA